MQNNLNDTILDELALATSKDVLAQHYTDAFLNSHSGASLVNRTARIVKNALTKAQGITPENPTDTVILDWMEKNPASTVIFRDLGNGNKVRYYCDRGIFYGATLKEAVSKAINTVGRQS